MSETILRDAGHAHGFGRDATHLIKVAVEAALGPRPKVEIFGSDYRPASATISTSAISFRPT
jgi:UDP-glucose 4-epimerase